MRFQVLVLTAFACSGQGDDPDNSVPTEYEFQFSVVDYDGTPVVPVEVTCEYECPYFPDEGNCSATGVVVPLDEEGEYVCRIDSREASIVARTPLASVGVAVSAGVEHVTLLMWTPEVTFAESGDDIVASWAPAPVTPQTETTGPTLSPSVQPDVYWENLTLDATSVTFPREDLEDYDATLELYAYQDIDGVAQNQRFGPVPIPYTGVVPASRGAACTVTQRTDDGVRDPVDRILTFAAGDCPLTDGEPSTADCGRYCRIVEGTLDLGAEALVRRVRSRGGVSGGVGLSTDGVAFTEYADGATLDPPVSARYVRVGGYGVAEISVFTP